MSDGVVFEERETAFRKKLFTFAVVNVEHIDIREFLADAFHHVEKQLYKLIAEHTMVKVNTVFTAVFSKFVASNEGEKVESQTIHMHTRSTVLDSDTDVRDYYQNSIVEYTLDKIEDIAMQGSGFSLSEITELCVQVLECRPIQS